MNKIQYYYTSMSKQVFLILAALLVIARFSVFIQVMIFDIHGYAATYDLTKTLILYMIYLLICIFFFFGYKLFYTTYDETEAVYHNCFLRKIRSVDLTQIQKALLNKKGVYLYYPEQEQACFFIPFWRLGYVSPVGVDGFYKLLKSKNISLEKTFTVLPGYGKMRKVIGIAYTGLALFTLGSLTQSVALAVAILKSH